MINEHERADKMARIIAQLNNEKYKNNKKDYLKYLATAVSLSAGLTILYYIAFLILQYLAK